MVLRIANIICLCLSVAWLIKARELEPLISSVAFAATLVAQLTIWRPPRHPNRHDQSRGTPVPCRFNIDPTWQKRKGWATGYADVLVELLDSVPTDKNVFLIPSDIARPELRNTDAFRANPAYLALKREATAAFIRQLKPDPLSGYRFTINTSEGQKVKVYSGAYDRFLNKYARKGLSALSRNA